MDVAIVGAGISGACVAHALARPARRVAVLDRRDPMMGSTVASTALLSFEIDRPLFSLARRIGVDRARRAWRRSVLATGVLRELVHANEMECDWEERESLYLAGDRYGSRALRSEAAARSDAEIPGDFINAATLRDEYLIDRTAAIRSRGSAVADPVRLTAGLWRSATRRGARIHSPVDVTSVTSGAGEVVVHTRDGPVVSAANVVFCSGYELLPGVPIRDHSVRSSWAFASAPGATYPGWLDRTIVWEASDPYLYIRTAPGGRLVVGGEDADGPTRHDNRRLLGRKARILSAKIRELLPGVRFRPEYRWGGSFGESATGLPLIDRVPGLVGCHVVMGFGGNGFVNSVIASQIVARAIEGEIDPDADLYRLWRP